MAGSKKKTATTASILESTGKRVKRLQASVKKAAGSPVERRERKRLKRAQRRRRTLAVMVAKLAPPAPKA